MPISTREGSGAVLDASWTSLGRLLPTLGRLWNPLGRSLAASWALSGVTWLISNAFPVHFSLPGRSGARFWRVWGHAGLGFRRLGRHVLACLSLRLAFHNIMLLCMQQPRFCIYLRFAYFSMPYSTASHTRKIVYFTCLLLQHSYSFPLTNLCLLLGVGGMAEPLKFLKFDDFCSYRTQNKSIWSKI